jgi:hypothetical protein
VFGQSLMDYLRQQKQNELIKSFATLQKAEIAHLQNQVLFTVVFWALTGVFCVFSSLYAIKIKKKYVKEVTLLSILNKEMIYNNKRVESFVHSLSKTS